MSFVHAGRLVRAGLSGVLVLALSACGGGGSLDSGNGGGGNGGGGGGGGGNNNGKNGPGKPLSVEFSVRNDSEAVRAETIFASVPFGKGQVRDLSRVGVKDHWTSWRALEHWADGSVRVAQAQFTDVFPALARKSFKVVKGVDAATGDFEAHAWTRRAYGVFTLLPEVVDDDGVRYRGLITGPGKILHSSYHARTKFWRLYLKNGDPNAGIKRDFLTARLYVTEYRDMPFVSVGMSIGNDYLGADDPKGSKDPNLYPLGAVSFKKVSLHTKGGWNKLRQRAKQGVAPPVFDPETGMETYLLLENRHLDDGQTKYWSFLLFCEDTTASKSDRDKWRKTWEEDVERPMRPLASLASWQKTGALGINGGPATGPTDAYDRAEAEARKWRTKDWFGPFGRWGDAINTHQTGTPRNHPVSPELARAIQADNPHLLESLEGQAWQQGCRQFHIWNAKIDPSMDIYLWFGLWFGINGTKRLSAETLGRFKLTGNYGANDPYKRWRRNVPSKPGYGWNPFDLEHASADLLFDYYTVTGDFWAQDELRTLGEYIKGVMRLKKYNARWPQSPRAEGWGMQALVECYLATGDEGIKEHALRRIRERIEPFRHKEHATRTMSWSQARREHHYPRGTSWFMPWQHAAVIYGYLGAHEFFGSDLALKIAEDAAYTADFCHVENFTDPISKKFWRFEMRYYVPVKLNGTYKGKQYTEKWIPIDFFDHDPNITGQFGGGGTTAFFLSAMYLLADRTKRDDVRVRALHFGDGILGKVQADRSNFWNKWASVIPDHLLPGNR